MKTKAKKLLSMLLSMILVLGMLPVTSFAAEGSEPLQTDGVYQIGTADELIWFAGNADPASKAVLTADIDLAGKTWTPMAKLSGSFDGQGHTIKNLSGSQGLFNTVYGTSDTARAEVKNVTVEGTVSGGMKIAGIAGNAYWANFTGVINRANVTGTGQYVAGIVGYSLQSTTGSYITLTNCGNEGTITGSTASVAGLVAYGKGSMVLVDCYNSGDITGSSATASSGGTGGLVGYTQGYKSASSLTNCYNTGNVNGKTGYAGGIVGSMYNGVTATNCYNAGTVTGGSGKIGAIAGYAYNASTSKAVNCYYLEGSCAAAATNKPAAVDAGTTVKTADEMKTVEFVDLLGSAYKKGETYPALSWETVDIQSSTYKVTTPDTVGITFTGEEEASSDALYKFSVAINDYYEITEDFAVKINGEKQEAASVEGHTYNFEYTAASDFAITVEGVSYTGVKLSQAEANLYPADTLNLTAEVDPAAEGTVVWASGNEAVATVADGVVTAVKAGNANITATIGDVSAICRITVEHKPTCVYNGGSWGFGQSQIATVTLYDVTVKEHRWVGNTCLVTLDKETPLDAAVRFDKTGGADLLINGKILNSAQNTAQLENGYAKMTLTAQTSGQNDNKTMIIWVEGAYEYVPVTGVEITSENFRVEANSSLQLTAKVLPENATVQDVTWSTTAPNTALMVQTSGLVQGSTMGHGQYYTVTVASVENPDAKADCQIYLDWKPEDSITLNQNTATLNIGETVKLSATVSGTQFVTNTTVTWSSSDENVATVSGGTVTAKKSGTATITATSYYGLTANCVVTVNACAHGETEISYGILEGTETHNKITSCKICKETIEEVTESCVDEDSDGICDLCKGKGIVAATNITLDKTEAEIQKGDTLKLTATVTPEDTTDSIIWSTSDPSVATVEDGVVTAVSKGNATITAQCGSVSAKCEVTVLLSGSKLTWWVYSEKATEITIKPGDTVDAVSGCTPVAQSTVTFTSADPEIVTVNTAEATADSYGHAYTSFTAKKAGETTVTAAYKTEPSVKAELIVKVVSDTPEQIDGVYQLATAEDLLWFAETVNGGNTAISAVLTADINLTGKEWSGIGTSTYPFAGSFDGQNKTVTFDNAANGLFAYVLGAAEQRAEIKNVITAGSINANTSGVAAIAGRAQLANISNCTNYASVQNTANYTAGIVGHVAYNYGAVTVSGCVNAGEIWSNRARSGGIVGNAEPGKNSADTVIIENCCNTAKVTAQNWAGGIVGYFSNGHADTAQIRNCYNTGEIVTIANEAAGQPYPGTAYGGITGVIDRAVTVENCYNTGTAGYGLFGNVNTVTGMSVVHSYYLDDAADSAYPKAPETVENSGAKTAAEMGSEAFATLLGNAYKASCPAPVLTWQTAVEHGTTTDSYANIETGTHSVIATCSSCGAQVGEVVTENCVDEDADGICDKCDETITAAPTVEGYTVTMPDDISIVAGETARIPVVVGNADVSTYNAFDISFTYDASKLELTSTEIEDMTVTYENGTIRVVRYGEDLNVGSVAFTLTFEAIGTGETKLTAAEAKVDMAENALMLDAPDATILNDTTVITIGGYSVTLPDDFTGESTVAPGEGYTFEAKDKNYNYDVTAKIDDTEITVTDNGDGTYTIPADQITGNIVITSTKEGKTFDVSLGEDMTGETSAQYMTPYTATLTKVDGYTYDLKGTIGGKDYTGFTYDEATGVVTIPGADITGKVEFNSNKTKIQPSEYTVTFEGNGAGDAVGENKVAPGADYSFTLNKAEGYTYTVSYKMGDSTESVALTEADGKYTIEKVNGNLVITVEKESDLAVEVGAYVELDGKTVFLVSATGTLADGKAYAYDGNTMYYSNVYKAWSYLVIVDTGKTFTADDAKAMITTVEAEYATLDQTFDVNMTNKVDVNDAQLVYNIYNCEYSDFTIATMQKFLNADTNGDKIVDTKDVTAVINVVINGTN